MFIHYIGTGNNEYVSVSILKLAELMMDVISSTKPAGDECKYHKTVLTTVALFVLYSLILRIV